MLGGDKQLDEAGQERYEAAIEEFYGRALDQIPDVLAGIPDERLQRSVYEHAFSPDSTLSERDQRPHLTAAYYVENVYLELAGDPTYRDELLQFTLGVQEYYDILDDVVDDDLEPDATSEATVVTQALFPLLVELVAELPDSAVSYWTPRAVKLAESWSMELEHDPSPSVYRDVLERQSHLYGCVTGLAAVVAGAEEADVERAETLGRALFKLDATWLDLIQYELELDLEWNVYELYDAETVAEWLVEWGATADEQVDAIAADREFRLRAPLAEEYEVWHEKYPSEETLENIVLPT